MRRVILQRAIQTNIHFSNRLVNGVSACLRGGAGRYDLPCLWRVNGLGRCILFTPRPGRFRAFRLPAYKRGRQALGNQSLANVNAAGFQDAA